MGKLEIDFDEQAFAQTASRFTLKRERFGEPAMEALARDIVTQLANASAARPWIKPAQIAACDLEAFCAVLTEPSCEAALAFIAERRRAGLTRHDVYLGYITKAAQWLGEQWDADRLSSFQVAQATGHLYALLRAIRIESSSPPATAGIQRTAVFATVPGEEHGLGITVAADLFQEAGWRIDLKIGLEHDDLLSCIEDAAPLAVGLSLSTEDRIEALIRLVVAIRLSVPHAILGVAPPADMPGDSVRDLVDIDLVFRDAGSACADLERWVQLRKAR